MRFLKTTKYLIGLLLLVIGVSSCGINSDIMFRSPKGNDNNQASKYYKIVSPDSLKNQPVKDYRLTVDDRFTLTVSPNDGQQIVENLAGLNAAGTSSSTNNTMYKNMEYTIRTDGYVNLPMVGDVHLSGLTIKESEDKLRELYSKLYINPFVIINVVNKRVIVFPGGGGDAKVVYLANNNTRLMEVLAEAGGLSQRGKAKSIKLMRYVNNQRIIIPIDLSTLNGLAYADIIVQGNDYIYVDPNPRVLREALQQAAPFFSFISTVLLLFNYFFK